MIHFIFALLEDEEDLGSGVFDSSQKELSYCL